MSDLTPFGKYFLPGPTEVPHDVLRAMVRPVMGHRSSEVSELMGEMQGRLSKLFVTERPVLVSTSSATGMMEAAITNLTRKRVLCLSCGAFSHRFYDIAQATGRGADVLQAEWGQPNRPEALREALASAAGTYDLVTVVHSESSTGVLNPLADLAAVAHEFDDVLIAVDTVSSLAGAPVLTDEWALDFVLTGSQKALAIPPGLAFAAASERAMDRAREVENRGFYFDLLKFEKNLTERRQTPNTPAVSLLFALDHQLRSLLAEGLEARWARHAAMAERTYRWVDELAGRTGEDYRVLAPEGYRSPCVTSIMVPEGRTGPEVMGAAARHGFTIATGYGKLKETSFRIGHMGEHTLAELEELLQALDGEL
ncbi:MAG: alanine--glyoxylate aminotransferase family protein [Gemmatimonadota bacterium]|nr:alanine--glyoxylate aminotransferase family protein [Gemmatimonadota bacterium]